MLKFKGNTGQLFSYVTQQEREREDFEILGILAHVLAK